MSAEILPAALLKRKAVVYVRQSTQTQVQTNRESQRRRQRDRDCAASADNTVRSARSSTPAPIRSRHPCPTTNSSAAGLSVGTPAVPSTTKRFPAAVAGLFTPPPSCRRQ